MRRILCLLDPARSWSHRILDGIAGFARAHADWRLDVMSPAAIVPAALQNGHRPDAVIGALDDRDAVTMGLLRGLAVPMVNTSGVCPPADASSVLSDDEAIGRMGAEHLMLLGYRHFAFVGYVGHAYSARRRAGFEARLQAVGATILHGPDCDLTGSGEIEADLCDWLRGCLRPLAVLAVSDRAALAVEAACARVGLEVPASVALLGVNNDRLVGIMARVPLASVDPNFEAIGARAAGLVHDHLTGRSAGRSATVLIPARGVVVRCSAQRVIVNHPLLRSALTVIRQHACERMRFYDMVRRIGTSRRTLERLFARHLHCTPHDVIRRARLGRACELLLETPDKIGRIALAVGYHEHKVFAREFRHMFGLTPRRWRQQARRQQDGWAEAGEQVTRETEACGGETPQAATRM